MIGVDLSRPWTIQQSLQTWLAVLTEVLMKEVNKLPLDDQSALLARQIKYLSRCYDLSKAEGGTFTIKPLGGSNSSSGGNSNRSSNSGANDDAEAGGDDYTSTSTNQPPLQLPPGILEVNLGVPIVVVGLKADAVKCETFEAEQGSQYLQQFLRRFCLQHGASLVYTSSNMEANVVLLHRYLLHR